MPAKPFPDAAEFKLEPWTRKPTQAITTAPFITRVDANVSRLTGGISIAVYGGNFAPGAIVTFPQTGTGPAGGSVAADGSLITALVVPPYNVAGYVDVVVTNPNGESATLTSGFLYYVGQMTEVVPPYAVTTGGVNVIIKGASFVTGCTFKFDGVSATNVTFIDDTQYSVTVPSHVFGYVDVEMTEPGGGTNTLRHGFQYTLLNRGSDIRRYPGTSISKGLGSTPDQATFSIDGQSHKPVAGEEVSVTDDFDGGRELFSGIIMTADQEYEGQIDQLVWRVQASDFSYILNKYRPFGTYFNVSASDVVNDLMSKYAPSFNVSYVQTRLALISISFDGTKTMSEALDAIAAAIGGGRWHLQGRALHFFNPPAPTTIVIPSGSTGTGVDFTAAVLGVGSDAGIGNRYAAGNYNIRVTFLYSNGAESRLGPTSNVIAFDGTKYWAITSIPLGLNPGGGITCVGRKIYYLRNADQLASGWRIDDNTTTAMNVVPISHANTAIGGNVTAIIGDAVTAPDSGTSGAAPAVINVTGNSLGMQVMGPYVTVRGSNNQGAYGYDSNAGYCTTLQVGGSPVNDDINQARNFYQGGGFCINFQTALGFYQFQNTAVYPDGSETLPTEWSSSVFLGQGLPIGFGQYRNYCAWWTTPQVFPLVNGAKPVKFRVYIRCIILRPTIGGAGGSGGAADIYIEHPTAKYLGDVPYYEKVGTGNIPEDSGGTPLATTQTVNSAAEALDFSIQPPQVPNAEEQTYVWPNPDGPYLEDYSTPHDIDDDDDDLLHEDSGSQPFTSTEDITQLRNRVKVFGAATQVTADAVVGDSQVQIADSSIFSIGGGKVMASNGVQLDFFSVSSPETNGGNANLLLRVPLTQALPAGTIVQYFCQAEDVPSQRKRGAIELDANGNPTDGVHEYVISDPSLASVQAVYLRANAELTIFKDPIITIRYSTRDPLTRPGARVNVDLTNPPCKGTFLIQSVQIDQIRDEGDQLAPRYTVTASNVYWDLTNFLLLLTGGNQVGGGGSSTQSSLQGGQVSQQGVVAAAVTQAAAAASSSVGDILSAMKGYVQYAAFNATNGSFSNVLGNVTPSFSGGLSAGSVFLDLRGVWARCKTSASNGNSCGYSQTGTFVRADHNVRVRYYMRTGDLVSNMRFFSGCSGGGVGNFANADVQSNISFGIRFSTAAGDTGFRVFSSNGTTMTLSAPFLAPSPNTEYLVDIQVSGGGTLVTATITDINGNQYTSNVSLGVTTLGVNMAPLLTTYTLEAVSKTIDILHLGFSFGLN